MLLSNECLLSKTPPIKNLETWNLVNMDTRRTDAVVSVSVLSKLDLRKNVAGAIFVDLKIQGAISVRKKLSKWDLNNRRTTKVEGLNTGRRDWSKSNTSCYFVLTRKIFLFSLSRDWQRRKSVLNVISYSTWFELVRVHGRNYFLGPA